MHMVKIGCRPRVAVAAILAILLMPRPAEAAADDGAWAWLKQADQATGSWGGERARLAERGVSLNFYLVEYFGWKDSGGVDRSPGDKESGSFDTFLTVDCEKLGWWRGGEFLLQVKNNWGANINPLVGALGDPIDDADGDHAVYIDQSW
jgi:carbohydrate-selective porin OprB